MVKGLSPVFVGEVIDHVVGAFFGDFDDFPSNLDIAIGIVGIRYCLGHLRGTAHGAVLNPAKRTIDDDMGTIVVEP